MSIFTNRKSRLQEQRDRENARSANRKSYPNVWRGIPEELSSLADVLDIVLKGGADGASQTAAKGAQKGQAASTDDSQSQMSAGALIAKLAMNLLFVCLPAMLLSMAQYGFQLTGIPGFLGIGKPSPLFSICPLINPVLKYALLRSVMPLFMLFFWNLLVSKLEGTEAEKKAAKELLEKAKAQRDQAAAEAVQHSTAAAAEAGFSGNEIDGLSGDELQRRLAEANDLVGKVSFAAQIPDFLARFIFMAKNTIVLFAVWRVRRAIQKQQQIAEGNAEESDAGVPGAADGPVNPNRPELNSASYLASVRGKTVTVEKNEFDYQKGENVATKEELQVPEYDEQETWKFLKTQGFQICVVLFVHYKFGYSVPLIISSVMGIQALWLDWALFKIYVRGINESNYYDKMVAETCQYRMSADAKKDDDALENSPSQLLSSSERALLQRAVKALQRPFPSTDPWEQASKWQAKGAEVTGAADKKDAANKDAIESAGKKMSAKSLKAKGRQQQKLEQRRGGRSGKDA